VTLALEYLSDTAPSTPLGERDSTHWKGIPA
jgi:hypothetical protein